MSYSGNYSSILMPIPIPREAKRGARLKCVYCRKKGATGISCMYEIVQCTSCHFISLKSPFTLQLDVLSQSVRRAIT